MKQQILIVDDNKDAADALEKLLRLVGFNVSVAYSGQEALELIRLRNPKIVLLDIKMPELDGYAVAAKIQSEPKFSDTVLIALTGFGQEEDKLRAHRAGFNYHLTKPVKLNEIKAILDFYVSQK